ncbi:MAG: S8 family serine peptidase, partial [Chloroflexi bacterium]|nr:S8 family serine peptidase [Chloroflexota bacterium]
DTGIRRLPAGTENELQLGGGYNCVPDGRGGTVDATAWADADPQGHGTHVAGIVGAIDDADGVVGVAPGARLWSVRVFDAQRRGRSHGSCAPSTGSPRPAPPRHRRTARSPSTSST